MDKEYCIYKKYRCSIKIIVNKRTIVYMEKIENINLFTIKNILNVKNLLNIKKIYLIIKNLLNILFTKGLMGELFQYFD